VTPPAAGDVALACAGILVDELVRGGVRHACLTPGSRSTPLALACARNPALTVHVHIDERASAYFALGIAKASDAPALALCTSGTAAANHFPAIVEASQACVPLIVLTADRPPELRDTGANQTIDQRRLFGGYVRWFVETAVPEQTENAAKYWRDIATQALATALGVPSGPVHLNMPFREPLVPTGASVDLGAFSTPERRAQQGDSVPTSEAHADGSTVTALAGLVEGAQSGLVVAGALPRPAVEVFDLCAALRWPLLAEPPSGLRMPGRALAAGQPLIADERFRQAHRPDLVLQIGGTPTTRAAQMLVREAGTLVVVESNRRHADPDRKATLTLDDDLPDVVPSLVRRITPRQAGAWNRSWSAADRTVRSAIDELLDSWDEPFEGRIARDVAAALPDGAILFAGSSMPVRDLDHYMAPRQGIRVLGNRGASGIDGSVSTTLGIAQSGAPAFGLIGDLALLHDASGLLWSARREGNAVLVVVDNNGGGIFSLLPQAEFEHAEFERLFGTPHDLDIEALAGVAGAGYSPVNAAAELRPAIDHAAAAQGVQIVHVPVDRGRAVLLRRAVAEAVSRALAAR
jgi:2-succinyl-5-enolpyruvyl-6-hydroxy-3-cyclohexene-1-carboxylate synthase